MTAQYKNVIKIESGGDLTLKDSNPTALHKFRTIGTTWVLDETDGTETVTGGVITGAFGNSAGGVYNDLGAFTMDGGNIVGNNGNSGSGVYNWGGSFTMNGGRIVNNYGDSVSRRLGINNFNRVFRLTEANYDDAVIHANGGVVDGEVVNMDGMIDCENGNGTVFAGNVENGSADSIIFFGVISGGIYLDRVLQAYDNYRDSVITGGVFYGEITVEGYRGSKTAGGNVNGGVFLGTGLDNDKLIVNGDRHAITVHLDDNVKMYNKELASTLNGTVIGDTLYYLGNPTRACHKFGGWYLDEECTIPVDFTKPVTEDITIYAKWIFTGHDFTAEIKSDDTLVSAATCQDEDVYYYTCSRCGVIEYDDTHTFEGELDPNKHIKALGDWQMNEDSHWKAYICCPTVTESNGTHSFVNGKCECGAVNYTVTFDANGGNVDTASATTDIWGKLNTLPTPTRSADYRFDGWYTAKEGGKKISGSTVFEAYTTVYARWTDIVEPTGEITLGTNSFKTFLSSITFGLFFKDTQEVTITATDSGSGIDKIYYFLSQTELSLKDLPHIGRWTEYTGKFNIEPSNKYIIYAKLTDKAGNVAYINSDGIVLDSDAPVISGIDNGKTYCSAQTVTVSDNDGIASVTVNGNPITPDTNGQFTLSPAEGEQKIVVTDKAGNQTEVTVTVNDGHTGGTADCTHKAKCEICDDEYGEIDETNHATLTHVEAKAATTENDGNIEYWHCEECGKYFSDKDGENEITLADTVIAKLDNPPTGDSHMVLWIALLFVSGCTFATVTYGKKKKHSTK